MQGPLVSVIIPVYNGERYLDATLKSVFHQDYQSIEIIVVDDGSADRTADIARSYQTIRYIYQNNQGPSAARKPASLPLRGSLSRFLTLMICGRRKN